MANHGEGLWTDLVERILRGMPVGNVILRIQVHDVHRGHIPGRK